MCSHYSKQTALTYPHGGRFKLQKLHQLLHCWWFVMYVVLIIFIVVFIVFIGETKKNYKVDSFAFKSPATSPTFSEPHKLATEWISQSKACIDRMCYCYYWDSLQNVHWTRTIAEIIIAHRGYHLISSSVFFSCNCVPLINEVFSVLWHWCSAWLPMSASHFSAMCLCTYSTAVVSLYVGGDARKV